jgi:hypothetical protein
MVLFYFLNLLAPMSPIRPLPRSHIAAGMGTAVRLTLSK